MKIKKVTVLCIAFLSGIVGLLLFIVMWAGFVPISCSSIATDNENNLFVGYPNGCIEVYNNSELIRTIQIDNRFSGRMLFTVSNEKIYYDNGQDVLVLDLYGNTESRIENTRIYDLFEKYRDDRFTDDRVNTYFSSEKFGYWRIRCMDSNAEISTVLYMPILNYIFEICLVGSMLVFIICIAYFLMSSKEKKKTGNGYEYNL